MLPERLRLADSLQSADVSKAVAVAGHSIENIARLFTRNALGSSLYPPGTPEYEYQKELLKGGGFLYYTFPILESIETTNPILARRLRDYDPGAFSMEAIEPRATFYALYNGAASYFEAQTGIYIDTPDIIGLAYALLPSNVTQKYLTIYDTILEGFEEHLRSSKQNKLALISDNLSLGDLKKVLATTLTRRGALIYFNQSLLQHRTILRDDEMHIVSPQQLTLDVVAGIRILSDADRGAFEEILKNS